MRESMRELAVEEERQAELERLRGRLDRQGNREEGHLNTIRLQREGHKEKDAELERLRASLRRIEEAVKDVLDWRDTPPHIAFALRAALEEEA